MIVYYSFSPPNLSLCPEAYLALDIQIVASLACLTPLPAPPSSLRQLDWPNLPYFCHCPYIFYQVFAPMCYHNHVVCHTKGICIKHVHFFIYVNLHKLEQFFKSKFYDLKVANISLFFILELFSKLVYGIIKGIAAILVLIVILF